MPIPSLDERSQQPPHDPSSLDVVLIINPAAGGGRGRACGEAVARSCHEAGLRAGTALSASPGDERRLAREASQRGTRCIAVIGGDGTLHHAVRGLLDVGESATDRPALAIFSAGTGNDFVKSVGIPSHDIAAMVQRVATGRTRTVDVGCIDDVPFVNAAGFGFDVEVLTCMEEQRARGSRLQGTPAYVITALRTLQRYRGFDVGIDDVAMRRRLMVVFANGRCFGGTFQIAPDARVDDGLLECIAIDDLAPWARLPLFVQATRGRHATHPMVRISRCAHARLHFPAPPSFECDGERHQARGGDVDVAICPGAVRVIV